MENKKLQTAILGGGCFWCLEAVYLRVKGVENVTSGYAGGNADSPTYDEVSGGGTGHAEVVKIEFDPEVIKYEDLLHIFFTIHDPTTLNRQGNDTGTQYRSIILCANDEQREIAEKVIKEVEDSKVYENPVVTEVVSLDKFYPAEDYHQRYFEKNPDASYCSIVIAPKVSKFREKYKDLYKE